MIRKVKGQLVSFVNSSKGKVAVAAGALLIPGAANAQEAGTTDALVTKVEGISSTATGSYVAAAGLGVAALIVSVVVYMSRKGWKLR